MKDRLLDAHIPGIGDADLRDLFIAAGALLFGAYAVRLSDSTYFAAKQTVGAHVPRQGAYETLLGALSGIAHPEDRQRFLARFAREHLQSAFLGGESHIVQQFRAQRADGGYQWLAAEAVRIPENAYSLEDDRTSKDSGTRMVLFVRSIDEEKRQSERDATLRALLSHTAIGQFEYVCTIDARTGTYALHFIGGTAVGGVPETGCYDDAVQFMQAGFIPENAREAFGDHMRLAAVVGNLSEASRYQYRFRLNDTAEQRWRSAEYCYLDQEKHELLMTVRDVHSAWLQEQKQLKAEDRQKQILAEALAIAKRESGAKRDFLASISQALRDPMNVIVGSSNMASASQDDPELIRSCLQKINTASHSLLSMITDLLDIARLEGAAATEPAVTRFPLRSIEADASLIERQALLKGVDIKIDLSELPDLPVTGDREALSKVLLKIGENAVQYTPPGGTVCLKALQQYRNASMLVARFIIADSGAGMDENQLLRLFEPFHSAGGAGLGMAISKRYADQIGATIDVQSKPGEGTTFTVDIPLEIAPDDLPLAATRDGIASESVALSGCRVLLAEDSMLNAEIASALLGLHGVTADHAVNGEEAVARYHAHPPFYYHAVLMDIQMPVLDGMEATRAIRASGREDSGTLPIIAMSANAFQEDLTRALQCGMNDYITKPFELERLLSSLRTHIGQRESRFTE